jgi:hypothetical protein
VIRQDAGRAALVGITLILTITLGVPSGPASAGTGKRAPGTAVVRNEAVARNGTAGRDMHRMAWQSRHLKTTALDANNLALAHATCTDCRTVAIALQVVLASDVSGDVHATNHAEAINIACSRCDTVALAYQFVVVTDGRVWLTKSGEAQLLDIRARLRDLTRSSLRGSELVPQAMALALEVLAVLNAEIQFQPAAAGANARQAAPQAPNSTAAGYEIRFAHETSVDDS